MVNIMKMDKKADSDYITFILPVDYSCVEEFKLTENDINEQS